MRAGKWGLGLGLGFKNSDGLMLDHFQMFSRLKDAITKTAEEEEGAKKKTVDVSFLSVKEVEEYKKTLGEISKHIEEIADIAIDNKESVLAFVREQEARKESNKGKEQEDEEFTLGEDLEEIKSLMKDAIAKLSKIQITNEEIKDRARSIGGGEPPEKTKEILQANRKYEVQLKALRASEENYKQILSTLKQQTELLTKQTKNLQQRCLRLEKDMGEKNQLVTNLQEQKKALLEMRSLESNSTNPEVESLKNQLSESQKKLAVERTKLQQKEKEIETLKKKLEEDRDSLQKIADELKEKELKSKKIIDKYERSKTEIRKYREEKTEFIKKLNMEIAALSDRAQALEVENTDLKGRVKVLADKNELLEAEISKTEGKGLQLQSARAQLKQIRQQQLQLIAQCEQKQNENSALKSQVQQLQSKRKSLLQALEKPINHEIRTLDKIIRALQKLYKEYIEVVFTQGNIIGFENKISYILSNVCEIKEDLKL